MSVIYIKLTGKVNRNSSGARTFPEKFCQNLCCYEISFLLLKWFTLFINSSFQYSYIQVFIFFQPSFTYVQLYFVIQGTSIFEDMIVSKVFAIKFL